ncbi:helix-turn-helix domain-containing protein [Nonomuraea sp. NPDC050394]|uniref:helix-turn-helix domain-containing protein n=1 Tax=Nonomuraea sp. NPDC050394 TaxID=3364363 RepID=UPI0037BCB15C
MANERLRATLRASSFTEESLALHLGLDPKSVQRWITRGVVPRRSTAHQAAQALGTPLAYLWPDLAVDPATAAETEIVRLYPHRSATPRELWLDLLTQATGRIWLFANASLFLPEDNPESVAMLMNKAAAGASVRIMMGDPDTPEMALRGVEEQLYDAIPGRIRMALAYYSPLVDIPGIEFRLHRTSLYNSIFRYDDEMLINQHIYGAYGYIAPILHLRRVEGGDFFDTYIRSFERVWETAYPIQESNFHRQRQALLADSSTAALQQSPALEQR